MEAPLGRVAVDTEAGWQRIRENVNKAIKQSMETRLALLPGGKEGEASRQLRKEVEARMARVQEAMWDMTSYNLRVNGHNYEDYIQATEPFDEALDRHLWNVYIERTVEEIEVSEMRHKKPLRLIELEESMEKMRTNAEWLPDGDDEEEGVKKKASDIPKPPRHDEVVKTFRQVATNITELADNVPVQLTRAQRAQTVREEIANLKS